MTTTHPIPTGLSLAGGIIETAPLGVGVWAWGDRGFWGYGSSYGEQDVHEAFVASINAGLTLFDTAEIYGNGESERILGRLIRKSRAQVVAATKFAPLLWRWTASSLNEALHHSLRRLNQEQIDLYQIHWPYTIIPIAALMDVLADAVAEGKIRAVGVSNYSADQMRRAHEALARRDVPLASNQVNYSLFKRTPEANGVLDACRELGVTVIAYSPLAQGLLTGKYTVEQPPSGIRYFLAGGALKMKSYQAVIDLLVQIGQDHDDKTPGQVALNWLMGQGNVLPIPGAKNASQAAQNAGALGWSLTDAERGALDEATRAWRK